MRLRLAAVVLGIIACVVGSAAARAQSEPDVPYVRTPPHVIDAMLDIARVGSQDRLLDLGSGDGRIVVRAAQRFGTAGKGVDLDAGLVAEARRNAERAGVAQRTQFAIENIFVTELSGTTVVTAYLLPQINVQLIPRFYSELRPGARVVSHDFDMGEWEPDARVTLPVPNKPYGPPRSEVYAWWIPANAAGRWVFRIDGAQYAIDVAQRFQVLSGTQTGVAALSGRLKGEEVALNLRTGQGGRVVTHKLEGRIRGDVMEGRVSPSGTTEPVLQWRADRLSSGTIALQ